MQNHLHCFFLWFLITNQIIFTSDQNLKQFYKTMCDEGKALMKFDPNDPNYPNMIKNYLTKYPFLITTSERKAISFNNFQTFAHHCANNRCLKILYHLYEEGETAAQPILRIINPSFSYNRNSTAFLNLCFQLNYIKDQDLPLFLTLLQKFKERTPAVATMARSDGKTPVEVIANSQSSATTQALSILLSRNAQAFASTIPNFLLTSSCITLQGECLCCKHRCLCCQNPKFESNHHLFWAQFYQNHPEHPNATNWFERYEKLTDNIW